MRRLIPILALVATVPAVSSAQQSTDGPYVLHEYVEQLDVDQPSGEGGAIPEAEPVDTTQLFGPGEPPALSLETRPGEPIYDREGPVFDRPIDTPYGPLSPYAAANTLDDRTDRVDALTYFANFDPSVIPYKRVVAKNHALQGGGGQYRLEVFTTQRVRVDANQEMPTTPNDVFWGTFLLRLERGRLHPIASVAPGQRILQVVTEPAVELQVETDGADNYFVRADQDGLVRLNIQVAVPSFYFGGPFPELSWSDFGPSVEPPLDPGLRAHALAIAQRVGFNKTATPAATVVEMVRYFRDFDARPFPASLEQKDLLEAIVTSQIGVCRHRSLAFVFLARAMGINTRYVYNEAHAFVEILWPGHGWRRLDLGGAANELNASANDGRSVHDPGKDGLPTPDRFLEEQQRMAHNGWEPPNDAPGQQPASGGGNGNALGGNGSATNGADSHGVDGGQPPAAESDPVPFQEPPPDERQSTVLRVVSATQSVRRGDSLRVDAVLRADSGAALANREIEVYLGPVGSTNLQAARRVGRATTDREGRAQTLVEIPREHAIGRWSLFLHFAGDSEFKGAVAE